MNIKSIILLRTAIGLLVQVMEVLNKIPDDDFKEVVIKAQQRNKHLKNIHDNTDRGNVFMVCFFLRELLESVCNE